MKSPMSKNNYKCKVEVFFPSGDSEIFIHVMGPMEEYLKKLKIALWHRYNIPLIKCPYVMLWIDDEDDHIRVVNQADLNIFAERKGAKLYIVHKSLWMDGNGYDSNRESGGLTVTSVEETGSHLNGPIEVESKAGMGKPVTLMEGGSKTGMGRPVTLMEGGSNTAKDKPVTPIEGGSKTGMGRPVTLMEGGSNTAKDKPVTPIEVGSNTGKDNPVTIPMQTIQQRHYIQPIQPINPPIQPINPPIQPINPPIQHVHIPLRKRLVPLRRNSCRDEGGFPVFTGLDEFSSGPNHYRRTMLTSRPSYGGKAPPSKSSSKDDFARELSLTRRFVGLQLEEIK